MHRSTLLYKALTRRYAVGLTLVASVIVSSYAVQMRQLETDQHSAHLINISGMQRMLSQHIAMLTMEMHYLGKDSATALKALQYAIKRMASNHNELLIALDLCDTSYSVCLQLNELYTKPNGISQNVTAYLTTARQMIEHRQKHPSNAETEQYLHILMEKAHGNILIQLDSAVQLYEAFAGQRINEFRNKETIILVIGLTLLILELLFIFRPSATQVLVKASALEQANNELIEFSYRLSHDLRAPVTSAYGLCTIIPSLIDAQDTHQAKKAMEHVTTSLKQLEQVIDDVVDFSRLKLESVEKETLSLSSLITNAIQKLEYMPQAQHVDIRFTIEGDDTIETKPIYIRQICENLISNAIKYHNPEAANPYVTIAVRTTDNNCTISVRDNGIGIAEEYHDRLFGMFERFHPKHSFGSGLGLYLVAQNAKALNGRITYQNIHPGSRFTLSFPV